MLRWLAGLRASGPRDRAVARELLEESERHLRLAGVVHAQEQHHGLAVVDEALHAAEGVQSLAREALGEERKERGDRRLGRELVVGAGEEVLDGLRGEDPRELSAEPLGRRAEGVGLIDGERVLAVQVVVHGSYPWVRASARRPMRGVRSSKAARKASALPWAGSGTDQWSATLAGPRSS